MMSDQQKEAMALLAEVWKLSPDIRLGQLFAHLGFLGEIHLGRSLGYIDDDELISVLHRHCGITRPVGGAGERCCSRPRPPHRLLTVPR